MSSTTTPDLDFFDPLLSLEDDFFDPLLSLEDDFYTEGYSLGAADGALAGRIEGRTFGLEKGFEKFLELGRIQGRCSVWKARTACENKKTPIRNARAVKNIEALALLVTNPPFKNQDEAVEEVEETLKRARVKVKVLENVLGEKEKSVDRMGREESIEDLPAGAVRR